MTIAQPENINNSDADSDIEHLRPLLYYTVFLDPQNGCRLAK